MYEHIFYISAFWGPRHETPEQMAARLLSLTDQLKEIDPVFDDWIWLSDGPSTNFADLRPNLSEAIAAEVTRSDDGAPTPIIGYSFGMENGMPSSPRRISMLVHAGDFGSKRCVANYASIHTDWDMAPDPALMTYPIIRGALLALAETWEVRSCAAYPSGLKPLSSEFCPFRAGWMSYLAPQLSHMVVPSPDAIVEYRPDGGLLMAATMESFSMANPTHVAAAREIEAALAPLNALPGPPYE